jgi:hypothetical protein
MTVALKEWLDVRSHRMENVEQSLACLAWARKVFNPGYQWAIDRQGRPISDHEVKVLLLYSDGPIRKMLLVIYCCKIKL